MPAREQRERRTVRRAFSFVTGLAVLVLPRHERVPAFRLVKDGPAEVFQGRAAVGFLDRVERRALRLVERVEVATSNVLVPTPRRTLDAGRREGADLGDEPLALLLAHVRPRRIRRCSDERWEDNG